MYIVYWLMESGNMGFMTYLVCIVRLCHIGLGFLKFSLIIYNSDGKILEKNV